MIRRLRLRMTLMVVAVLVLVSAGIVLAIHLSSQQNIAARAESALPELAMDRGEPAPADASFGATATGMKSLSSSGCPCRSSSGM